MGKQNVFIIFKFTTKMNLVSLAGKDFIINLKSESGYVTLIY